MDPRSMHVTATACCTAAITAKLEGAIKNAADGGHFTCNVYDVPPNCPTALAFFAQFTAPAYEYEWRERGPHRAGAPPPPPEMYFLWVSWANAQ